MVGRRFNSPEARSGPVGIVTRASGSKGNRRPARAQLSPPELRRFVAISEPVEPGDVLVIDRGRRGCVIPGSNAADSAVIGVVSADPGRVAERAAVTVSGVVLCKADASYAPIREGDTLSVSPTRGHAMLCVRTAPGSVLGKALQKLPAGCGLIKVLVTLR